MTDIYDCIIIGGGPGGFSSAIYLSRYNLKVKIITGTIGGQIALSAEVENYPGVISDSGFNIMNSWKKHAEKFGTEVEFGLVSEIEPSDEKAYFKVTVGKKEFHSRSILLATGAEHRKLGVPGEKEFQSKGVSYCPTCDGMFFKDKVVAVVGGGDAALRGAQLLVQYCTKVYLIHRRDEFRAEPRLVDQLKKNDKIEFVLKKNLKSINGTDKVEKVVLDDDSEIKVDGVFIEIGSNPNTDLAEKLGLSLKGGLIDVSSSQETSVPGVYAAGDVTTASNQFRQVITAASEGAIAAETIFEYLKKKEHCAY